jgi:ribosome-associated toxin RatA of RatAB toxin-antitoxin module
VRHYLSWILVAGALLLGATPAPPIDLSGDQRQRLGAGDVVVLDTLPPGAGKDTRGATGLAVVRATPAQVWRVLIDYPGHVRYYPRVIAVQVIEADERHALVRYKIGVGPTSFAFHMEKYPDPVRRRIEWHLAEGRANSLFRENSGYWQVDETSGGALVTYAIAVRTILPAFATAGSERQSVVDTITALRKLVESGAGASGG